jgi:hypothetical protein
MAIAPSFWQPFGTTSDGALPLLRMPRHADASWSNLTASPGTGPLLYSLCSIAECWALMSTGASRDGCEVQVSSRAFATSHGRYGTLSWAVQENDDEQFLQQREGYMSTEFLITTGQHHCRAHALAWPWLHETVADTSTRGPLSGGLQNYSILLHDRHFHFVCLVQDNLLSWPFHSALT